MRTPRAGLGRRRCFRSSERRRTVDVDYSNWMQVGGWPSSPGIVARPQPSPFDTRASELSSRQRFYISKATSKRYAANAMAALNPFKISQGFTRSFHIKLTPLLHIIRIYSTTKILCKATTLSPNLTGTRRRLPDQLAAHQRWEYRPS